MIDPAYTALKQALAADDIHCQFQKPGQFVISSKVGPVWPNNGNSFWVTHAGGDWHLFTWAPVGYRIAASASVADVCRRFMASSNIAAFVVPVEIAASFGLVEISAAAAQVLYQAMAAA